MSHNSDNKDPGDPINNFPDSPDSEVNHLSNAPEYIQNMIYGSIAHDLFGALSKANAIGWDKFCTFTSIEATKMLSGHTETGQTVDTAHVLVRVSKDIATLGVAIFIKNELDKFIQIENSTDNMDADTKEFIKETEAMIIAVSKKTAIGMLVATHKMFWESIAESFIDKIPTGTTKYKMTDLMDKELSSHKGDSDLSATQGNMDDVKWPEYLD